jgi:hypothetical protein
VSTIVNDKVKWIFRRVGLEHDFGADGYIDIVKDDGRVTGQSIAVQIKSGKSFFSTQTPAWGTSRPRLPTKSLNRSPRSSPRPVPPCVGLTPSRLTWARSGRRSAVSSRTAIERVTSSTRFAASSKKVPPRYDPLDINQAIFDATTLTRNELVRHRIALQIQPSQELPVVQADRIQLQQVLLNLIINAIEAMSAVNEGPRELLISSATNAVDSVIVAVRDSGPGLTPEEFHRVFQAFHTTKPGGMGMGLSICRSIVEAHGGRVWATANAPRGAVFQFTLPAQRESIS